MLDYRVTHIGCMEELNETCNCRISGKSKTIAKYLGDGYKVDASRGHIWDLPEKLWVWILKITTNPNFRRVNPNRKKR